MTAELDERTRDKASNLRAIPGFGALSAAKFIGEVASIERFKSRHAFARHNGATTAPQPVSSRNRETAPAQPHRQPAARVDQYLAWLAGRTSSSLKLRP